MYVAYILAKTFNFIKAKAKDLSFIILWVFVIIGHIIPLLLYFINYVTLISYINFTLHQRYFNVIKSFCL